MKPLLGAAIMAMTLLGCATPQGTYRDYFGFRNVPRVREQPSEQDVQPSAQRAWAQGWPSERGYAVTPAWVWEEWYAPWYPYPVWYCSPGYIRWHSCWCAPGCWYPSRWWCSPRWFPPVVVVVPVEPQPPVRVRRFGPARGSIVSHEAETLKDEAGGGRRRVQQSGTSGGMVSGTARHYEHSAEQGGGRTRRSEYSQAEGSAASRDDGSTEGALAGQDTGGARSRSRP